MHRGAVFAVVACALLAALVDVGNAGVTFTPLEVGLADPVQLFPAQTDVCGLRLDLIYGRNDTVYGADVGLVNWTVRRAAGLEVGALANAVGVCSWIPTSDPRFGAWMQCWGNPDLKPRMVRPSYEVMTGGSMSGVQLAGLFNLVIGESATGLQVAGLFNENFTETTRGVQIAGLNLVEGNVAGVQIGVAMNLNGDMITGGAGLRRCDLSGVQLAVFGNVADRVAGVQLAGGFNEAREVSGLQICPFGFNVADRLDGVQIGLVNFCGQLHGVQIGIFNVNPQVPVPFVPLLNARF